MTQECGADVLSHPWLRNEQNLQRMEAANEALMREIDNYSLVDSLKEIFLRVVGRCLPHREVLGAERMFQTMDADHDGRITVDDLKVRVRPVLPF